MTRCELVCGPSLTSIGSSGSARRTAVTGQKRKRQPSQHPDDQAKRENTQQLKAEKAERAAQKIYVGIDLGTTYTGVGYVTGANPERDVSIVSRWGRGQQNFQDKVPSVIGYATDNPSYDGEDRWGCQIKPGDVSFGWWKLLLDDDFNPGEWDDKLLRKCIGDGTVRLPAGKTAEEVATDYLTFIHEHIFDQLRELLGPGLPITAIDWCLTVQATWSMAARSRTRDAAMKAGFGTRPGDEILLIDEPQAGILETLYSSLNKYKAKAQPYKKGSSILCVDLGDLISYKVAKLDPLRLEEAAVGIGAKAGASSIDRAFFAWCLEVFGVAFSDLPLRLRASGSKLMCELETAKQQFLGTHFRRQETSFAVPLRMKKVNMEQENVRAHYDAEEGNILFSAEELQSWFQPVLKAGFELIRNQVAAVKKAGLPRVETIVLIGGLAANAYIEHSFKDFVEQEFEGTSCLVPERAWSAICRGAALHAYDRSMVLARRARDNLGYPVHKAWEEGVHLEEDRMITPSGIRARNQMHWAIHRGMRICKTTSVDMKLYAEFERKQLNKRVLANQDIFTNQDDDPPERLDESCEFLGTLAMDLTASVQNEQKRLRKATGSEPDTIKLDVRVKAAPGDEKGILVWRGVTGRQKAVGSIKLEYCADPGVGRRGGKA